VGNVIRLDFRQNLPEPAEIQEATLVDIGTVQTFAMCDPRNLKTGPDRLGGKIAAREAFNPADKQFHRGKHRLFKFEKVPQIISISGRGKIIRPPF
jgi:hypothetical protein